MSLGIAILILNYKNYHHGVLPTFLKPIEFLAGKCSPIACGLHKPQFILRLARKTYWAIRLTEINTKVVCFVSFVLSFVPALINFGPMEIILFGLPWSIVFAVSSYYTFSSYFWNLVYFYILCHHIKYQIRETNLATISLHHHKGLLKAFRFKQLEQQYVAISNEVNQFNNSYWCKYLFIVIVLLSTFNNTVLYTALFVKMNIVVKVSVFYATAISSGAIFFVLNTASVVYHQSSRTQRILYNLSNNTSGASNIIKVRKH